MRKTVLKEIIDKYWGVIISLIVINTFFGFTSEYYLTTYNIYNIIDHSAISLILSIGMVFVLASGGIDLSVGSTLAFTGIIAALLFTNGVPTIIALVLAVLLGMFIGFTNGLIISHYKLQPFIVTLAMLSIARGLALVFSGGNPIIGMPSGFLMVFAGESLLGNGIFIALGITILAAFIFTKTKFGTYVKAIGGNEEATYLVGVKTSKIKILVYVISGFCATIASFLFMASMDAAEPIAGLTTEWMEAIAAPIIGGNSLNGGKAYILGTVIGVFILSSIKSGLNMMGVGQHFQQIAIGTVIVAAVILDSLRRKI
jgi:ribose transport system permease protein